MGQTAMWRLRRLGPRAAQVAERYAEHDAVAVCAARLLPTLGAFTRAYDEARHSEIPWARDADSGRTAVYDLVVSARMWLPLVVRDLAGIDRSNYLDSIISDDVIDDIDDLISLLRDGRGADGEYLPYRDSALERIDQAMRVAQSIWLEAEAADFSYAARLNDLRWKAVSFRAELQWFGQSVAFVLDHTNPDYLRLLPSRAWHLDSADDRLSPQPEIVEPATLVTGIPRLLEA
jgi:hypothetical protein